MATALAYSPKALARRNRIASKRTTPRALTPRVQAAIQALVWGEATSLKKAAEIAQLTDRALQEAFTKPEVKAHYQKELEVLRNGGRARSIRVGLELMDDAKLKKTAAGQKVRLESAKFILDDPADRAGGVHVNVGVSIQSPGYQVKAGSDPTHIARVLAQAGSARAVGADAIDAQLHRLDADDAKPLIEHQPVQHQAKERG